MEDKNSSQTIQITNALWGGGKAIGHPEVTDRMFGVAGHRLKGRPRVNLRLSCLRNNPVYEGIDTEKLVALSESKGWVNSPRGSGVKIYHLTIDELAVLATDVREQTEDAN